MHTLGTHAQVDALVSARTDGENDTTRRLKNELLVRMSEAAQGVLVLAATNVPWALDPAVRRRFERRIHVPLPEAEARATLLRIHLGATPHELSAHEVLRLATRLDGFSGSDLSVLVRGALREAQHAPQCGRGGDHTVEYASQVRDALMEPVRMLQAATHFRQEAGGAWAMCEPRERGAVQMRLMQVPPQQLRTPHVTLEHLERAMLATRPSVGPEDLHRFEEFTRQFGAGN
jgi:vacuolar protein-sorting-associated protein 4